MSSDRPEGSAEQPRPTPHPRIVALDRPDTLGRGIPRIDGTAKVTGGARYAVEADENTPDDPLYAMVVGATIGAGRICSIDTQAARAVPGVVAVVTDHPRLPSDNGLDGQTGMRGPQSEIDFYGQPIGIVVAKTAEAAREGARAVRVTYERATGRFDEDAVQEVDHDPKTFVPNIRQGDLEQALSASDHVLDRTYRTPRHYPAALEPHGATVWWAGERLIVRGSLQVLGDARKTIAAALDIDADQVRILAPFVGGGFGGKTGVGTETVLAAIAARETGRAVRIAQSRRQTAQLVHHRSPAIQRLRIGCDTDGTIRAVAQESLVTQKDGRSFVEPVAFGSLHLYAGAVRHFTQGLKRVDLPATGAVRAPGEAIGTFGIECAMDELAHELEIDPIDLRRRNEPPHDPVERKPFSTRRLLDCYAIGAERFGWTVRHGRTGRREGDWWIGTGMAAAYRGNFTTQARARVRLAADGTASVETDMTDIGTGTYTILAQIAAQMLGLSPSSVNVTLGDTDLPASAGSGGSFGAGSSGSAVALACTEIMATLARRMNAGADELRLEDGCAIAGERRVALPDLLRGDPIVATGHAKPGDSAKTTSQASHGAHFAEVAVHAATGEVRVRRMLGVFDIGRVLNRATARSQLIGGMAWGIGYALHEDAVVDRASGRFANPDFGEYQVATHADVPAIDIAFVEEVDDHANEVGAKGVGELGIAGAGAAVANAIHDACGVRVRTFPATPDRIIEGLPDL